MMTDPEELWATCRAILRKQVPEPTWNTWLAPLILLEANESHFVVGAPSSMILERVATRYQGMIEESSGRSYLYKHREAGVGGPRGGDCRSSGSRRWYPERHRAPFSRSR